MTALDAIPKASRIDLHNPVPMGSGVETVPALHRRAFLYYLGISLLGKETGGTAIMIYGEPENLEAIVKVLEKVLGRVSRMQISGCGRVETRNDALFACKDSQAAIVRVGPGQDLSEVFDNPRGIRGLIQGPPFRIERRNSEAIATDVFPTVWILAERYDLSHGTPSDGLAGRLLKPRVVSVDARNVGSYENLAEDAVVEYERTGPCASKAFHSIFL